uniref:Putative reverse transcriptase, intron maturase and HNH endonuclease n=1 Tax=Rhexinema sarcinoideum TaxID=43261 RepID=A0A1B2RYS9_9CHLO|nr:putative reverse transcriptase, intron maturase and HNH endonuclease [Rhexinema sarcinoideum]
MNSIMSILENNKTWNKIRWTEVRKRVLRMQHRIFMAKKKRNQKVVKSLQIRLINSLDAKLLSVLQVTTLNKRKSTPGVDKQIIVKPEDKLQMALRLKIDGKAKPIRRVWMLKPGKIEKRPLGIHTIIDRAKQNLTKLALEPEWEAVFEANSYGFRPGRSCQDAIEAIFNNLRHKKIKYVFDADIRKCFDRIDHDALLRKLQTIPQIERQIQAWLKAGLMEGYINDPKNYETVSNLGTSQGEIISPLLANIALHGLENHLKNFCTTISSKTFQTTKKSKKSKRVACGVIRYADDFVVVHENKAVLSLLITESKEWLKTIGLEIREEKSKLRDVREGFKFLGFQIILVKSTHTKNYKVKITPSKVNCLKLYEKIRTVIQKSKAASAYELIHRLRPIIVEWGNYYCSSECKRQFQNLDYNIFDMIRAWAFRRDTRNNRTTIKEKYFPSKKNYVFDGRIYHDNWILVGQTKRADKLIQNFLPRLSWIKSRKHIKIIGEKSPFDGDHVYWTKRLTKYSGYPSGICKLMKKQNFTCPICNNLFITEDRLEIDHIIPKSQGGMDRYSNLQLLHKVCHLVKTREQKRSVKREVIANLDNAELYNENSEMP